MEGWIQTDGSCDTLQYAKKVNKTTWLYRQWLDKMVFDIEVTPMQQWREAFSCEHKLSNWEDDNWVEEQICLSDYPIDYIEDCISTYGYAIVSISTDTEGSVTSIVISAGRQEYSEEDSIQLCCECIFELQN
jgi:hypothetical protein